MKHIKIFSSSVVALTLLLGLAAAGPASARRGVDDSSEAVSNSVSSSQTVESESTTETHSGPSTSRQEIRATHEQSTEVRQEHQAAKTPEQHKKKCEAHKQGLTNKFNRIVGNSQKAQSRIDEVLAKAIAYQQANNLHSADIDNLVAAAESAKVTSATSTTALQAIKPTLDCNNVSVAGDVATFKTAVHQAHDNLKAYHKAVKAVLKALETVKPATDKGSNQ